MNAPQTQAVLAAFARARVDVRLVGGCVRDALLGRAVKDIDLATPALPEAVTALLEEAGIAAIPTGIAHGTVMAVIQKTSFEITTLRRDVACDGRHAVVEYTDRWEEDAARRDFTMNALYLSPQGELFDYFGGAEDARAGRIRFIGDPRARIREDALRILRYFRFYAHYGKEPLEEEGLKACVGAAETIDALSGERICAEMMKLLAAPDPARALEYVHTTGTWPRLLPSPWQEADMQALVALERERKLSADAVVRLALILREGGEEVVKSLAERWKISGALKEALHARLTRSLTATSLLAEQKKLLRRVGRETFLDLVTLAWANERARKKANRGVDIIFVNMRALAESWKIPVFPVTGADLIARGYQEGRELGRMLKAMEEHWESHDYAPKKEALLSKLGGVGTAAQ